jgi:hypothetical protein
MPLNIGSTRHEQAKLLVSRFIRGSGGIIFTTLYLKCPNINNIAFKEYHATGMKLKNMLAYPEHSFFGRDTPSIATVVGKIS